MGHVCECSTLSEAVEETFDDEHNGLDCPVVSIIIGIPYKPRKSHSFLSLSPSLFNGISSPPFVRVDTHSKNYISHLPPLNSAKIEATAIERGMGE